MGGVAAASRVLGATGFARIMAAAYRAKPATPKPAPPARSPEKKRAALVAKTALTPSIWRLEFELDQLIRFVPGQYVMLRVAPFEWRDYSIAAAAGKRLTLLVSTRTGGDGSRYADAVEPGARPRSSAHSAAIVLTERARKVFVATGTGLAPFLPMFADMAAAGELGDAEFYFGCRSAADDLTRMLAPLPRAHSSAPAATTRATEPFTGGSRRRSPASPSNRRRPISMFAARPLWWPTAARFSSAPARRKS